jgi:TusA-related sulfurtransferase
MYYGKEVIQFLSDANVFFQNNLHVLLLTETSAEQILSWCQEFNLSKERVTIYHAKYDQVPYYLSAADFAINPQRSVESKRFGTPVKDGEYWAMGLPVVIPPNISEDSDIVVAENLGVLWKPDNSENEKSLTQLKVLLDDKELNKRCVSAAKKYRGYALAEKAYAEVYKFVI